MKKHTDLRLLCRIFLTMLKIGAFTFGGGYAMIALLEHEFVEKRNWIDKEEFLNMVAIAESTPGPIAINSATYLGYKTAGVLGSLVGTVGVVLPSFTLIFVISLFFDRFLTLSYVAAAFRGVQACVVYLILTAGIKLLGSIKKNAFNLILLIAVMASMLLCSIFAINFSSVFYILIGGIVGLAVSFVKQAKEGNGK